MCFKVWNATKVQTIETPHTKIVAFKKFTLRENSVLPRYMRSTPYKVKKLTNGVKFTETTRKHQPVIYNAKNQDGCIFSIHSRRKLQVGMHAKMYCEQFIYEQAGYEEKFYPILINPSSVIMLTEGEVTVSSFIIPTEKIVNKILKETEIKKEFLLNTDEIFFALHFYDLMQTAPEKTTIELIDSNLNLHKVEATKFGNEWAAHKALNTTGYTVTHIPSKRCVGKIESEFYAKFLALRLSKELSCYTGDISENKELAEEIKPKLFDIMDSIGL